MKRLLCGTLTALFISLPLYANTPDASTSTTTETMKTETMSPGGTEVQREEESVHRSSDSSSMSPGAHQDAQMQQAPASGEMKKEKTTTTEEVED